MPKKKTDEIEEKPDQLELSQEPAGDQNEKVAEPEAEKPEAKKGSAKAKKKALAAPLYAARSWKGVRTVYRCEQCGHCEDDQGDMQLHVLTHFPMAEREEILNKLLED